MKYAVLIYGSPDAFAGLSEAEQERVLREYVELIAEPCVYGSAGLQPVATAATVRVRQGKRLVTDGPFPEMKEFFGGFYLIDVPDREAALAFAERVPAARMGGAVEIRPIAER